MEEEKETIFQQRKELEEQGVNFYYDPNENKKKRSSKKTCCNKRYISWFMGALFLFSIGAYFISKGDDKKKVFSSGDVRIEASLSYTQGIDGDVNVDLLIFSNDGEVFIKEKTIIEVIFSSDSYVIVNLPIVFYQNVAITKSKRIPYTLHLNKGDFLKSTKMGIRIAQLNFDETVRLR